MMPNATHGRLQDVVSGWAFAVGIAPAQLPSAEQLASFEASGALCRPGSSPREIAAWERRHGFRLPFGLRTWLELSNGLDMDGPLIHPLTAIGPMIPFARVPDLLVQPESWFELGNPRTETICIDLAYAWPATGGCCPLFSSGDDERASAPRIIAASFEAWLLRLLKERGREFWFDPGFTPLGDPWDEHRRQTPAPPLPAHLEHLAQHVRPLMSPGADDRSIADQLGITRGDLEAIFRHLQHCHADRAGP